MMPILLLSIALLFTRASICFGGIYDPSPSEISRAIVFPPDLNWGNQIRREQSLRIVLYGAYHAFIFFFLVILKLNKTGSLFLF